MRGMNTSLPQTRHVRIDAGVYKRLLELSRKTGMSAAQIATLCIDDCMKAYVDHKPFTPKVLRIMNILDDAEAGK